METSTKLKRLQMIFFNAEWKSSSQQSQSLEENCSSQFILYSGKLKSEECTQWKSQSGISFFVAVF